MARKKTAFRLMEYVASAYKFQFIIVVLAIVISAMAGMAGPLFLLFLIDDYITPLIGSQNPDFSGLAKVVLSFASVYSVGVICTYIYNRLMVNIGQGVLNVFVMICLTICKNFQLDILIPTLMVK